MEKFSSEVAPQKCTNGSETFTNSGLTDTAASKVYLHSVGFFVLQDNINIQSYEDVSLAAFDAFH